MNKLLSIVNELNSLYQEGKEYGLYNYNYYINEVLVSNKILAALCKDNTFTITKLPEGSHYNYRYEVEVDGFNFVALAHSPNYEVAANE